MLVKRWDNGGYGPSGSTFLVIIIPRTCIALNLCEANYKAHHLTIIQYSSPENTAVSVPKSQQLKRIKVDRPGRIGMFLTSFERK